MCGKHRARTSLLTALLICAAPIFIPGCGENTPQGPPEQDKDVDVVDVTPPSCVTMLRTDSPTGRAISLIWEAPGDDGDVGQADRYDIRCYDVPITGENWDLATQLPDAPAPKPAGQLELFVVKYLESSTTYYFALRTYDEASNVSPLSNCAQGTTLMECIPPAPVTDLRAHATSDTEFLLSWTATGDDVGKGTASYYDIRYSTSPITAQNFGNAGEADGEPSPKAAGEPESFAIGGLTAGTDYYFAMKVADEVENWSTISNCPPALAMSHYLLVHPTNIDRSQVEELIIIFRTLSSAAKVELIITQYGYDYEQHDWVEKTVRHLVDDYLTTGAHTVYWDFKKDDGYNAWGTMTVRLYWDGVEKETQGIRFL